MKNILAVLLYWKVTDLLCKAGKHDMDRGGSMWRCCRNVTCDYAERIAE